MPGFFGRIKQWIGLDNLTAIDLNKEINNILTNLSAPNISGASGYPATLAGMQALENPGGIGTEVLPVTIQDEVRQLRFMLESIVGEAQWYSAPPVNLVQLQSEIAGIISQPGSRVISGRLSSQGNNQPSYLQPDGTAATLYLRATATPFMAYLNDVLETFDTDIAVTGLSMAPGSNNSCTVNDATLSGGTSTLQQGELATSIGISAVGSNITSLSGKFAAFKHNTEYFIAQIENNAVYATPTGNAGVTGNCATTSGSSFIIPASFSTTQLVYSGMTVSGSGIPGGTTVLSTSIYGITLNANATGTTGSTAITFLGTKLASLSSIQGIQVGQAVSGTGVVAGTTVIAIGYDGINGSTVTLSAAVNAVGSGTYTFSWTRLKNAFRGVGFDSSDTWMARTAISNGDSITLMKLTWVFASFNSSAPGVVVTYNEPTVSYAQPSGASIGDFWYNLTDNTWEVFNSTAFVPTIACFIGITIQDTLGCKAARSADFYRVLSQQNTLEPLYFDSTDIYSQSLSSRISVYGRQFYFQNTQPMWNTTSSLDSGQSLTINTQYYCYVTDIGDLKLSTIAPTQRKFDLLGAYHPAKPWRCVATFLTDSSSNIVDYSVSFKNYYQFVMPTKSVSGAALEDGGVTAEKLATASVQSTALAANAVGAAAIQTGAITNVKLGSSLQLPGSPTWGYPDFNYNFALSNSSEVMVVCRGQVSSTGTVVSGFGSGFSASTSGAGNSQIWTVTFDLAFSNTPTVVATAFVNTNAPILVDIGTTTSSSVIFRVVNSTNATVTPTNFNFIAIGPK